MTMMKASSIERWNGPSNRGWKPPPSIFSRHTPERLSTNGSRQKDGSQPQTGMRTIPDTRSSAKALAAETLEAGYWHAYQEFYRWKNILRSSQAHEGVTEQLRHLAYAGGWKKFEPMW